MNSHAAHSHRMAPPAPVDNGKALVQVLACILTRLVQANDAKGNQAPSMTKFHALRPPDISIADYLQRIKKFAACSTECFVLALVYIDRLIRTNHFVLNSLNVHRVIITSVMLAAKFFDDEYFKNRYYAQVGGVPCSEMNNLELEFLFSINFTLHVKPADFAKYEFELKKHVLAGLRACTCCSLRPHADFIFATSTAAQRRAAELAAAAAPVPPPAPEGPGRGAGEALAAASVTEAERGASPHPEEDEDTAMERDRAEERDGVEEAH